LTQLNLIQLYSCIRYWEETKGADQNLPNFDDFSFLAIFTHSFNHLPHCLAEVFDFLCSVAQFLIYVALPNL
jgi:hypothetical protein